MTEPRKTVTAEVMEGIALVTFNLPPRNSVTAEAWQALTATLADLAANGSVRVLVLTGAGHAAFATDPDAQASEEQLTQDTAAQQAREALAQFPAPVIARVRGDCIGAGLLLALAGDLIVAAEDSAFALPAASWGGSYGPDAVAALVRLIGPQHAARLLLTGGRVEAQEALRIGLVTLVVPDADLSATVVDLARGIADNAPLAIVAAKRLVRNPDDPAAQDAAAECRQSEDYANAVAAIRDGRAPSFQGR